MKLKIFKTTGGPVKPGIIRRHCIPRIMHSNFQFAAYHGAFCIKILAGDEWRYLSETDAQVLCELCVHILKVKFPKSKPVVTFEGLRQTLAKLHRYNQLPVLQLKPGGKPIFSTRKSYETN